MPLFIGLGAGALLLFAVCVSTTLWLTGAFSKSSEQIEAAQRERERQDDLQQPSVQRPAFWHSTSSHESGFAASFMSAATLTGYERKKLISRTSIVPKAEIELWSNALRLKGVVEGDEIDWRALATYLALADGLYENDVFQPARSERYRSRLARLPEETVDTWHTVLNRLPDAELERIETVLYVIQFEALFDGQDGMETNLTESGELLQRLQSIDPNTIEEWAELIDSHQVPAALALIQMDSLFRESIFDKGDFRTLAAAARTKFPAKK